MGYKRFGNSRGFRPTGKSSFKKRRMQSSLVTTVPRPLSTLPTKRSFTFMEESRYALDTSDVWFYVPSELHWRKFRTYNAGTPLVAYVRVPPGFGAFARLFSHARLDGVTVDTHFTVVPPTNFLAADVGPTPSSGPPGGPIVLYDGIIPSSWLGPTAINSATTPQADGSFQGAVSSMKRTILTSQGSQNSGYHTRHHVDFRKWHNVVTLPSQYSVVLLMPSSANDSEGQITPQLSWNTFGTSLYDATVPVYATILDLQGRGRNDLDGTTSTVYVIARRTYTFHVTFSGNQVLQAESLRISSSDAINIPN